MNKSKAAIAVSKIVGLVQLGIGLVCILLFGLVLIMWMTDAEYRAEAGKGFAIFCFIVVVIGVFLVLLSRKRKKLIKEFRKYVSFVSADPTGSIANIAAAMGTSQDVVKSNLELMIKKKYFVNAHINQETNSIVLGGTTAIQQETKHSVQPNAADLVPITCKCCGGMNMVPKGTTAECDFCGSPING